MVAVHDALEAGSLFCGRYRVEAPLDRGGMSLLYRVTHLETERVRALKLLSPRLADNPEAQSRFQREARMAGRIDSEHVVDVIDAGFSEEHGAPFIVMELLDGQNLRERMADQGRLGASELVDVLRQVAKGLDKAHAAGVVHRDLKPANIFLEVGDEGRLKAKLLDFGIAKLVGGTQHTSTILGTPLFMAPEQIRFKHGNVGPATDVYALAHVAYAALVGEPYFAPEDDAADNVMQLLMEVAFGAPEPASTRAQERCGVMLPAAFDAWFEQATAQDAGDRLSDAGLAVAGLAVALGLAEEATATTPSTLEPSSTPAPPSAKLDAAPREKRAWAGWAVLGLVASGAIAWIALQEPEPWTLAPHLSHNTAGSVERLLALASTESSSSPVDERRGDDEPSPPEQSLKAAQAETVPPVAVAPARAPKAAPQPAPALPAPSSSTASGHGYEPPLTER